KTLKGEWRFDTLIGVPWFQTLLGRRGVSTDIVRSILRSEIQEAENVGSISELKVDLNRATRVAAVEGRVLADDGEAAVFSVEVSF
ncbi:MAG: hypothetical protein AAFU79_26730, partial [Myxococcota bacterium]